MFSNGRDRDWLGMGVEGYPVMRMDFRGEDMVERECKGDVHVETVEVCQDKRV